MNPFADIATRVHITSFVICAFLSLITCLIMGFIGIINKLGVLPIWDLWNYQNKIILSTNWIYDVIGLYFSWYQITVFPVVFSLDYLSKNHWFFGKLYYIMCYLIIVYLFFSLCYVPLESKPWDPNRPFHVGADGFFDGSGWGLFNNRLLRPLANCIETNKNHLEEGCINPGILLMHLWPKEKDGDHRRCFAFGVRLFDRLGVPLTQHASSYSSELLPGDECAFLDEIRDPRVHRSIASVFDCKGDGVKISRRETVRTKQVERLVERADSMSLRKGNREIIQFFRFYKCRLTEEQFDLLLGALEGRDSGSLSEFESMRLIDRMETEWIRRYQDGICS